MNYNEQIKQLLDDIIADMNNNRGSFVKNPDKDFTRDRKLPFEKVIKIVLSMKGNTLNKELYDFFGRTPEDIVTSSAFVQQRDKLADNVFEEIFHRFAESMTDMKTFRGYKLYAVDGSDINIAYNQGSDTFMEYGKDIKGVNQYHLNAVYDLINKVYIDANITPRSQFNERRDFIKMFTKMNLTNKTLFIADRGYPSWNMFAHFEHKNNADYLFRVKNGENTLVKKLPMAELDIDKCITVTTNRQYADKEGYIFLQVKKGKQKNRVYKEKSLHSNVQWDFSMFEKLNIRIVRFEISPNAYETIFTSLPREKFSIADIKKIYGMRWGIETSFRELKYIIGLTNMHCKKEEFARQEIFAKLTMYNFCERIIAVAVVKQDDGRKYKYQVNYTMGMQICLDFYRSLVKTNDVYTLILKYIVAIREGRHDKRKMKPKLFVCFTYRVAA
jgi:hypothetical protein